MGLHEQMAITHERRQVDPAVLIRQRDLVVKIMHREQPGVEMMHDASGAHGGNLVCIVIAHVSRDITTCRAEVSSTQETASAPWTYLSEASSSSCPERTAGACGTLPGE